MGFDLYGKNGSYFRNTIWQWHPLWDYVCQNCSDILTTEDIERGNYNDDHFISEPTARRISRRLQELRDLGYTTHYAKEFLKGPAPVLRGRETKHVALDRTINDERSEPLSDECLEKRFEAKLIESTKQYNEFYESGHKYTDGGVFDEDNVSKFSEFCEKSRGFIIS